MARKRRRNPSFASVVAAQLRCCDGASTAISKGRALEELITAIFQRVPGIEQVLRNTLNSFSTEEIDLAVGNAGHRSGLAAFPDVILVECKNWSNAVGSQEVTYFVSRLRQRGCVCGILIAMNDVTGDARDLTAARFEIATALKEKIRVIVLRRQELEVLRSPADFVQLLKRKMLELIASGTTI
jgi:hypothetical protein